MDSYANTASTTGLRSMLVLAVIPRTKCVAGSLQSVEKHASWLFESVSLGVRYIMVHRDGGSGAKKIGKYFLGGL